MGANGKRDGSDQQIGSRRPNRTRRRSPGEMPWGKDQVDRFQGITSKASSRPATYTTAWDADLGARLTKQTIQRAKNQITREVDAPVSGWIR